MSICLNKIQFFFSNILCTIIHLRTIVKKFNRRIILITLSFIFPCILFTQTVNTTIYEQQLSIRYVSHVSLSESIYHPIRSPNRSKDSRTRPFERNSSRCIVHRSQCIVRLREAIMMYSERVLTSIKFTYKSNNDYNLQLTRWFLLPIAAWPRTSTSTVEKVSLQAQVLACSSLIAVVMVPCMLYVSLEEKDVQMKLSAMGPLSHWIMGTINYWLLLARSDDIRECVLHMETDWRMVHRIDDQDVMLRYAKIGRFIAGFCAVIMQSGTFLFTVAKAMTSVTVVIGNETSSMHPMTCPIYSKFIDTRFSPANEIMLVVEILSCFIVNSITVGACSLAAVFAMHAYGQLSMLFSWLNNLVEDEDKGNDFAGQKLATIVEHHLRVLRYSLKNRNVFIFPI